MNKTQAIKTFQQSMPLIIIIIGLAILFVPTYIHLYDVFWQKGEMSHGPLVLLIVLFLFWQKKKFFFDDDLINPLPLPGSLLLIFGLLAYIVSKWQSLLVFEVFIQLLIITAVVLLIYGPKVLRKIIFPIFFLLFLVPLPASIVDAITLPMKIAVSTFAEYILYNLDYPIARNGVILQIGFYKLLVADACAGLQTVFTLEAMGLLYLHLVKRDSFTRNLSLALLIIPISFVANTIRVVVLVLVTYYFGDEVGQGFLHDFAGFVLFGTALIFIIFVDTIIHKIERWNQKRKQNNNT